MSCPTLETAAAWLLDALTDSESEAFEEHYFGCERCWGEVKAGAEVKAAFASRSRIATAGGC